ncbi:MAG: 1-deoxy-D-xylulose-5-phosphate synthase [Pseudomonadota bacterium]
MTVQQIEGYGIDQTDRCELRWEDAFATPYEATVEPPPNPPLEPARLRDLPLEQLPGVCDQLRQQLIESVALTGGHFAAGLGVVELTVALHHTYATPDDPLIWDVGHQCYPHKILTGRLHRMHTIRQHHGMSGFPTRQESAYDAFGVAHAGTSISAALGMSVAMSTDNSTNRVVCVIGDGALTEGMAFEALNHAGATDRNLTIVLNDNAMSISPNVGALSNSETIHEFFRALGCHYHGPHDGHNVVTLANKLQQLKRAQGIQVLHIHTQKGHGYARAEKDPVGYHAVPPFDPDKGLVKSKARSRKNTLRTYTQVFSDWVCDAAADNEQLVAVTPAMREGSGLVAFQQRFPDRYHDVGIAEQHAVTFAAGLACQRKKPVVAIYSSFLQRAYDQLIHDVALQNLDVLFAIDRAGVVGADGATHHGSFDLSYLRCVPNLCLMAPADEQECRLMLQTGLQHQGPAAVRYERGNGPGTIPDTSLDTIPLGVSEQVRVGKDIAILSFGGVLQTALEVADLLDATVINMRFIKPLDTAVLQQLARTHSANPHAMIVTLENNAIAGGAGSAVNEALQQLHLYMPTLNLGYPDCFIEHGTQAELLAEHSLDTVGIYKKIKSYQQTLSETGRRPRSSAP